MPLPPHSIGYNDNAGAHDHKWLCRDTACRSCESACAHKFACRHNPCSTRAVGCVRRCLSQHTPCISSAAARARRSSNHHNPCTDGESARARKFACRHNPCSTRAVGCVCRCLSHHTPCIASAGARARTCMFWSCLTTSRREAVRLVWLRHAHTHAASVVCSHGVSEFAHRIETLRSRFRNRFFAWSPPAVGRW